MKKFLSASLVLVFILTGAASAYAQTTGNSAGFVPLVEVPGLTTGDIAQQQGLADFFNNLYKYLIGLAAVLAVIMIIWGGLEISTQDSISSHSEGKNRIYQAIIGLVLVLSPVIVFSIINPSILQLSLNLEELDTAPAPYTPSTGTTPTGTSTVNSITAGGLSTGTSLYSCSGSDCSGAQSRCSSDAPGGWIPSTRIVCVTSDGRIDETGRTDSSLNPFSDRACVQGETLAVACSYSHIGR